MSSIYQAKKYCLALLLFAYALGLTNTAFAQSSSDWQVAKTAQGYPDLQGYWDTATLTPFQRPQELGDRQKYTTEEVRQIEQGEAQQMEKFNKPTDPSLTVEDLPKDCGRGFVGLSCGYNHFWIDPGTKVMVVDGEARTSMVVNPKNGRPPALKPAARKRRSESFARRRNGQNAGPESRSLGERCLMSFGSSAGPPMLPQLYNSHYQIVQNKDTVMILAEMVHDVRIIRINDKHNPSAVQRWMGDSIGHYEGNSLVIETVNLRSDQGFRGAGPNAKYIERLTPVGPGAIKYEFKIEDGESFTQDSWGGELIFNRSEGEVYEYACHEGNYALPGILQGARLQEQKAAVN